MMLEGSVSPSNRGQGYGSHHCAIPYSATTALRWTKENEKQHFFRHGGFSQQQHQGLWGLGILSNHIFQEYVGKNKGGKGNDDMARCFCWYDYVLVPKGIITTRFALYTLRLHA
jgi:hypothetical protein